MSLKKSFIIILILSILGSVLAACKPPRVYPPNAQLEAKMKDHILDESERGGFQTINPYLTPPPLP